MISKLTHFTEQGFEIKGVIHVGTNTGQEMESYIHQFNLDTDHFLGFEPLPEAYITFEERYPGYRIEHYGLGKKNETRELQVTATAEGQSSTVFEPNVESGYPLTEIIKERIPIVINRLDKMFTVKELNNFNAVVIDVQGMELETLTGFGKLINKFKYYIIECSKTPIYKGEATAREVVEFMIKNGFTQDTPIQLHDDIMFIRSDIKQTSDLVYRGLA